MTDFTHIPKFGSDQIYRRNKIAFITTFKICLLLREKIHRHNRVHFLTADHSEVENWTICDTKSQLFLRDVL